MLGSFQKIFKPTQLDKELQDKFIESLELMAYEKKYCHTCINYIPVDINLPSVCTAYPECKLGGIAWDTCDRYVCNKRKH